MQPALAPRTASSPSTLTMPQVSSQDPLLSPPLPVALTQISCFLLGGGVPLLPHHPASSHDCPLPMLRLIFLSAASGAWLHRPDSHLESCIYTPTQPSPFYGKRF